MADTAKDGAKARSRNGGKKEAKKAVEGAPKGVCVCVCVCLGMPAGTIVTTPKSNESVNPFNPITNPPGPNHHRPGAGGIQPMVYPPFFSPIQLPGLMCPRGGRVGVFTDSEGQTLFVRMYFSPSPGVHRGGGPKAASNRRNQAGPKALNRCILSRVSV